MDFLFVSELSEVRRKTFFICMKCKNIWSNIEYFWPNRFKKLPYSILEKVESFQVRSSEEIYQDFFFFFRGVGSWWLNYSSLLSSYPSSKCLSCVLIKLFFRKTAQWCSLSLICFASIHWYMYFVICIVLYFRVIPS